MPDQARFSLNHHSPVTMVFVIPPRVHLLDFSGPAHVFYEAAEYGAPISLKFVSVLKASAKETSSNGLTFSKLESFNKLKLKENDIIFIPGLDSRLLADQKFTQKAFPFYKWIYNQYNRGVKICSVCTGAFLLAQSGLLNGRQTTTHWKFIDQLQKEFPLVEVLSNRLFVQSERLYSSAGVSSGIDLSLYLLEEMYGTRFSAAIAREVVIYLRRSAADPQLSIFLQYRNHLENRIHTIQEWLTQHLDKKITAAKLADMVHTSERNLTRLFKVTTGITIGQYVEKLRVTHALHLLRQHQKVEQVAKACGLQSTNQLRSLLKKHSGVLPSQVMS